MQNNFFHRRITIQFGEIQDDAIIVAEFFSSLVINCGSLFFFFTGKLIENLPRELLSNRILKAQSRLNHFHVDSNTSHIGLILIQRVWF